MPPKTKYADLLQLNKDLTWFSDNAMWVPKNGQIVWVNDNSGRFKKGNGISMLGALPFLGGVGSATWGAITGSLSAQTDLISYLDNNFLKYTSLLTGLSITGGTISSTDNVLQAFGKLQNQINAIASPMVYQGVWNANINSPTLTSSTGTKGSVYRVTVSGSTNLDGITDWKAGDFAVYNGTTWDKWDSTDAVTSVNGYVGNVNLIADDLLLTGYVSGAGTVLATDTVLEAIQKLNGNIAANVPALTSTYIGYGSSLGVLTGTSNFTFSLVGSDTILNIRDISSNGAISLVYQMFGASKVLVGYNSSPSTYMGTSIPRSYSLALVNSGAEGYAQNIVIQTTDVSSGTYILPSGTSSDSGIRVNSVGLVVDQISVLHNVSSTARLQIRAGSTTIPSLKIGSGSLVSTITGGVNNGAIEYDGTHFYCTIGSNRHQLDQQTAALLAADNVWTATTSNTFTSSVAIGLTSAHSLALGDSVSFEFGNVTGSKIGKLPIQKFAFWGATPITQPDTAIADAVLSPVGGGNINILDTFDGYTLTQVVAALRLVGLLA